jgi:hypothetical protein
MSKTADPTAHQWVKSSYSGNGGAACVEWAPTEAATSGAIPVRDSKYPNGPVLMVSSKAWTGLIKLAKGTAH